jgi:hypothetical protein
MDAVPQYGLLVFKENKILFNQQSASERDKQEIALLLAKNLAELVRYMHMVILKDNPFVYVAFYLKVVRKLCDIFMVERAVVTGSFG